jgi:hypothetical protein
MDVNEVAQELLDVTRKLNLRLDDLNHRIHRIECSAAFMRGFEQHTSPYADRVKVGQFWEMKTTDKQWGVKTIAGNRVTLRNHLNLGHPRTKTILTKTLCKNYRRVS